MFCLPIGRRELHSIHDVLPRLLVVDIGGRLGEVMFQKWRVLILFSFSCRVRRVFMEKGAQNAR